MKNALKLRELPFHFLFFVSVMPLRYNKSAQRSRIGGELEW